MTRIRKLLLSLLATATAFVAQAQSTPVDRMEYFFDTDPGHGKGIVINDVAEGENTLSLSVDGLKPGAHLLFVRSQDSDGVWSTTQAHAFYLSRKKSDTVVQLEYFFDEDPGYGKGTIVADAINSDGNAALTIPTDGLKPGAHNLCVRALANQGEWSPVVNKTFYLLSVSSANIRQVEYFFDKDPGYGKGLHVSAVHEGSQELALSTDGLKPGAHILFVRSQTDDGLWSGTMAHPFYIWETKAEKPSRVEYFFDEDPGYGKGKSIALEGDSANVSLDVGGMSYGAHMLFMRMQDEQGHWSTVLAHPFLVCDRDGFIAMEYYIDNDPGEGKATTIDIPVMFRDSDTQVAFSVPTDELEAGEHTIYVRGLDAKGNWCEVNQATFSVTVESVPAPVLAYGEGHVTMTCEDAEATIGYTLDGTEPTKENCVVYTEPVAIDHNLTVKAFAYKGIKHPSEVVSLIIDEFIVAPVTIVFADQTLTMSTTTEGAVIYYTLDGTDPTEDSNVYTEALFIDDDCVVKAYATKAGYHDSPVSSQSIVIERKSCDDVAYQYNGRYITLSTHTDGAIIRYTIDGTEPTETSPVFTETVDVGGLCTVKAIATKERMNPSALMSYDVPCYYDAETAQVRTAGTLDLAFGWCGRQGISRLTVTGSLNDADLTTLRSMEDLRHVNLKQSAMISGNLPDGAFADMGIISIELPSGVQTSGDKLFDGCTGIAAIGWNATVAINDNALAGIDNPNLLLYADSEASVSRTGIANIVADGTAKTIQLYDTDTGGNFYSMRSFVAQEISYTHNYSMQSGYEDCRGWETLALPFDVQNITHESRGQVTPFASVTGSYDERPFWLCELTAAGWNEVPLIKANTPYLICMPNNDAYSEQYQLAGNVTFSSTHVQVPETENHIASCGQTKFVPTTISVPVSDKVFALNLTAYESYAEGSVFIAGLREVRPFEAYRTTSVQHGVRYLPIRDEGTTGITQILLKPDVNAAIYDVHGRMVRNVGQSTNGLPSGIYIQNGRKMFVK